MAPAEPEMAPAEPGASIKGQGVTPEAGVQL